MADDLVIKGEKYISAKRAAEVSGYKQDYVGQLCRSGKIAATLIGRNWFVSEKSILEHKENIAALILEKKELNKKKIKQTFSFFNQKTISAEESTALNIPLTTTDTSEPKKQNQWFPLEQFIGAPFQEKVLASLILVIVLAGSFFYCNPEKVEGVIATFNRVQDSVSTEASNIAHIILEQGEKIGAAANQSIITTAIATANFGNSLSESVSNLSVIPRALQNTYRKIFVFVSESAHAVAFAVASTFENFQNSLALFAESAAHALAQSQNTVSFVSGDIAARTIEKVITPVQEKIKAAGNNLALFGIRASGAVASTIYGTRDKAFYVVKNIRSRVSAMYTGDSYTDTDVSLKIPADDNNPSSDIKQSMGETYRSNVAFIEKGIVLSITDVVDEFKKVGTRTKEIWNTVLARENNKDGENTSKNLTDTFTSNTSNNITPHFKAFIWKPSFQVELPKLPKLSSLQ
ncbi:MAG: helix-turn-helix domain-containing protein, partial [Candidatus Pacebacteria bacterium]|nr:helix-turn-helix domain-containing protein [Candidatus Paceibacterota bacterium]